MDQNVAVEVHPAASHEPTTDERAPWNSSRPQLEVLHPLLLTSRPLIRNQGVSSSQMHPPFFFSQESHPNTTIHRAQTGYKQQEQSLSFHSSPSGLPIVLPLQLPHFFFPIRHVILIPIFFSFSRRSAAVQVVPSPSYNYIPGHWTQISQKHSL